MREAVDYRKKPTLLYALLLSLTNNGRDEITAGVMWLGAQVGMGSHRANRWMRYWRDVTGEVEFEAKQGRGTRIRITEKGVAHATE